MTSPTSAAAGALAMGPDDSEPSAKVPRLAQPDAQVPQEGWGVEGFTYCTNYGMPEASMANIFLLRDQHGKPQGVQWWRWGPPTSFHGSWETAMDGSLVINFNWQGPVYEDGHPTRMMTTFLRRQTPDAYEGLDEARRKIRLEKYGSWVVQAIIGNQIVYVPTEERSIKALWAKKEPSS